MANSKLFTYIEALFAVTVWGASFVASKVALQDLSPTTLVWLRFLMGVAVLGVAVIVRKQFALPDKKEWIYFALLGFLGITFHQWLQSNALVTSEAGTSAWIVATSPIFIALLGWVLLKEPLDWIRTLGILLAFCGVLVVVSKGDFGSISIEKFGAPGDKLILVSSVNWAVFSALSRRGLKAHPASLMMFYVMMLGWLFTSLIFLPTRGFLEIPNLTFDGWLGIAFLGIFCSGLAYIAWYDALQALPAAQTGAFLYIEPPVSVVVAFFILGEAITLASLIGGAIVLFGVWLVNRTRASIEATAETD
ncbi:MAG: DMT family transporter [Anaerolineales bacterium]|nr:DMT family transporter [Anaerolineales bacterium]